MPKELSKAYEPQKYEDEIYKRWEQSGFFNPDNLSGEPFAIMMPPPNVTGVLHLGHALENSLMDTRARFERMRGKKVLLLAGTDHAAIATQARVEKNLMESGIKDPRTHFGREGLLAEIKKYAEASKQTILSQIQKMGTSCDWSRLAYTFDEQRSLAVNTVFKKMYDDGLIYRGYRVVNWSVKGRSTCSDDELVYVDRKSKIYTFKYSKDFPFAIATTRPETKLGDTAVAVNPKDKRYKKYIGQVFEINFCGVDLKIKIIGEDSVEQDFGTGALGVTPAHSTVDFDMYERRKLNNDAIEIIPVIGIDGKMTERAGQEFVGKTVEEARGLVVDKLRAQGLLEKEEEIDQSVGTSDRFGDVVEAVPLEQWWLDVNKKIPSRGKSLCDLMREAVTTGLSGDANKKVNITPDRFAKLYLDRVNNLRDWCLSRQIWWGHRVPVWYCRGKDKDQCQKDCKNPMVAIEAPTQCPVCDSKDMEQDPDTLDTWFSSGLWTFSTLGWPKDTNDFKTFHPTSWMQMGYEILYLWLMRMILFSAYNFNDIPFKDAYIHGILRDKHGQKFSKSAKNGIDPLEVIGQYGCDALRISLLSGVTAGNDSRFYLEKVEGARNLVNKIWNISRYILENMAVSSEVSAINSGDFTLSDKWILSRLDTVIEKIKNNLEDCQFSLAIEDLREFTWNDLADWYLEIAKIEGGKDEILQYILQTLLKLWHPFMPFVTEQIWSEMFGADKMLMVDKWPVPPPARGGGEGAVGEFVVIQNIITTIRSARAENKIEPNKKINAIINAGGKVKLLTENSAIIAGLARLDKLTIDEKVAKPANAVALVAGDIEIYLDLSDAVDAAKETARLTKELVETEKYAVGLQNKLANAEFVNNAPPAVVEKEKKKLAEAQDKLEKLQAQLNNLK